MARKGSKEMLASILPKGAKAPGRTALLYDNKMKGAHEVEARVTAGQALLREKKR